MAPQLSAQERNDLALKAATHSHVGTLTVIVDIAACVCNRFERKKGIDLALKALHELQQRQPSSNAVLVVAGGYDVRLAENREHLKELQQLAQQLDIKQRVLFVPSFTDRSGAGLLQQ
jgi:glycosyltransferase involved in cell wall biosynthesis